MASESSRASSPHPSTRSTDSSLLQVPSRPQLFRNVSSSSSVSSFSSFSSSLKPQKDKPRLYIALYPRGDGNSFQTNSHCDSYHWAITIGPPDLHRCCGGVRYHAAHHFKGSEDGTQSQYEEQNFTDSQPARNAMILLTIAKITDQARVEAILRSIPTSSKCTHDHDASFNCLAWVKQAYLALVKDKHCLKGYVSKDEWPELEDRARKYIKRKRTQRRYVSGWAGRWQENDIPTWNYWENRETVA